MTRIRKLLIANRGEIASRVIRTARSLDIATVAVFAAPDSGAPYVAEADEAVPLPGTTAEDTYLRKDLLIDAALYTGADAVHPGYGFLSENADFAEACAAAGLTFVGPPPAAIRSMGSKTSAKQLMARAGVPVLPGIAIGDGEQPPAGLADRAQTEIGFPVLVKAAFGGGGRGMRVVATPGELTEAVAAARREAVGAFGNGTVFLERLVERPRHIEVQVFADTHGQVVHLFERECSIQRRYQKILEESPSPVVDDTLRAELGSAAIAAAKAIGYVGAGTVEFILDASGEFFFLEVNTRLQVEHPVTELVTGLDLVSLQLMVAEGKPLPDEAVQASVSGHAIEARLYAEDVAAGYLPATGSLLLFDVPSLPGVRIDAGVRTGGQVSVHYDPMLAKVIAHAPTREQAARLLARALAETRVLGVVTNRDLLVGILREQDFLDGHIDTGYLTRHDPATLMAGDERRLPVHALATALADQALRRAETSVLPGVPSGWRNVPNARQQAGYQVAERGFQVEYGIRGPFVDAAVDGVELGPVLLHGCTAAEVDLQIDGVRRLVTVARAGDVRYAASALGATTLVEQPRFPETQQQATAGSLLAPMPGTVVRVEAQLGDSVHAGQVLVVLEAMKMEHSVRTPQEGTLARLNVSAGQTVEEGTVLAVVENATGSPADGASGRDGARD